MKRSQPMSLLLSVWRPGHLPYWAYRFSMTRTLQNIPDVGLPPPSDPILHRQHDCLSSDLQAAARDDTAIGDIPMRYVIFWHEVGKRKAIAAVETVEIRPPTIYVCLLAEAGGPCRFTSLPPFQKTWQKRGKKKTSRARARPPYQNPIY